MLTIVWLHILSMWLFYSWPNIAAWTPALTPSSQSAGKEERKAHPYPLKKCKRVYWSKTLLFTFYGSQLHHTATHRCKGIQERQFYRVEMDSFLRTSWEFLSLSYLSASLCVPEWTFSLQAASSRRQGGKNDLLQLCAYTIWVPLSLFGVCWLNSREGLTTATQGSLSSTRIYPWDNLYVWERCSSQVSHRRWHILL